MVCGIRRPMDGKKSMFAFCMETVQSAVPKTDIFLNVASFSLIKYKLHQSVCSNFLKGILNTVAN